MRDSQEKQSKIRSSKPSDIETRDKTWNVCDFYILRFKRKTGKKLARNKRVLKKNHAYLKTYQTELPEMKVIVEIKKSMARLNSRLDTAKELISKLEEQSKEIPLNVTKTWRFFFLKSEFNGLTYIYSFHWSSSKIRKNGERHYSNS